VPDHSNERDGSSVAHVLLAGLAAAVVFAVISVVVSRAEPDIAPVHAVYQVEGFGCRRLPTRTVATVVALSPDGGPQILLSVAHGVVGQDRIELSAGQRRIALETLAVDTEWDLALLRPAEVLVDDSGTVIEPVRFAAPREGNAKVVIFVDSHSGREPTTRSVIIERRLRIRTEDIYLQDVQGRELRPGLRLQAEVVVGDSGAPVFNPNGEMVAIIWGASRKVGTRAWATRVEAADALLQQAIERIRANRAESVSALACAK
jgi:hypothetical protein